METGSIQPGTYTCSDCHVRQDATDIVWVLFEERYICRNPIDCKTRQRYGSKEIILQTRNGTVKMNGIDLSDMADRNYEFRNIPGVGKHIKVSRDGEVQVNGRTTHVMSIITSEDGTRMSIQMCIHKAFPDIPMRETPTW